MSGKRSEPMITSFTVYGRPQQKGSKSSFAGKRKDGSTYHGVRDMNPRAKQWQGAVTDKAAEAHEGDPWDGPVILYVTFFFGRPKSHYGTGRKARKLKPSAPEEHTQAPDLSKLTRTLEDAMNGVVYANDCQIYKYGGVSKLWTTEKSRTVVTVERISDRMQEAMRSEDNYGKE